MTEALDRLLARQQSLSLKAFYAQVSRLPAEDIRIEAQRSLVRRRKWAKLPVDQKPVIRVFKAQGKPLMVCRVGSRFVSAFTWAALERKIAFGSWKVLAEVTLGSRWK